MRLLGILYSRPADQQHVNSSSGRLEAKHGGKIRFGDGFFCHTFNRLVPPDKYFDQHPEYFLLVKSKRLKQQSQLCSTNEDVIRLCTESRRTTGTTSASVGSAKRWPRQKARRWALGL